MSDHRIRTYLLSLARLCIEVLDRPALWPTFLGVLRLVPRTLHELAGERRRMAT